MSLYVVFQNLFWLLIDALTWFLGGAIIGVALETFLPTAWATRGLASPRASILHATLAGALLPGCSMTTVPLAAALKARGARLGTLTGLGAASSSCPYAAAAAGRSAIPQGAALVRSVASLWEARLRGRPLLTATTHSRASHSEASTGDARR